MLQGVCSLVVSRGKQLYGCKWAAACSKDTEFGDLSNQNSYAHMNTMARQADGLMESSSSSARKKASDRLVLRLLVLGMIASAVMMITYLKALESQAGEGAIGTMYAPDIVKPT